MNHLQKNIHNFLVNIEIKINFILQSNPVPKKVIFLWVDTFQSRLSIKTLNQTKKKNSITLGELKFLLKAFSFFILFQSIRRYNEIQQKISTKYI